MLVPHTNSRVASLRFSRLTVYITAAVIVGLLLTGAGFTYSYRQMTRNMDELEHLRLVNGEQKAQIDQLAAETSAIEANLQQIEELDSQLREIMKLAPKAAAPTASTAADAGIADATQAKSTNQTDSARPANQSRVVSRGRTDELTDLSRLQLQLDALQQEVAASAVSLTELKGKAISHMAYLAAKPAGWPASGRVTSDFGYRRSPIGRGTEYHDGFDIAAAYGTPIVATGSGTVSFAGWRGGYGQTVIINHGYGFQTLYGHTSRLNIRSGQKVVRGQVVAYMGSSGRSTGTHVHYQVMVNGRVVDPELYLGK